MTWGSINNILFQPIKKAFFVLSFSLVNLSLISAQESSTLFFMHTLPQSNLTNPAVQIPCKVFVGMPLLSSIHFNYSNSYFSYNDLISGTGNSLKLNYDFLTSKPSSTQNISTELHISLINFGFLLGDYYFNFNVSDKINGGLFYSTGLFDFAKNLNKPYIGKTAELGGFGIQGTYYREWAFGVSKIISDKLTLGVKAKLLFGKANISTTTSEIGLFTASDISYLKLSSDIAIMASPLKVNIDANKKLESIKAGSTDPIALLLNSQNKGVAFDLGAIYNLNERITLSGSLIDLGFIHWKFVPATVTASLTKDFPQYKGFEFVPGQASANSLNQWLDSAKHNYNITTNTSPYYTSLSPIMYIGGTYALIDGINAGLMSRNQLYYGVLQSSVTTSLNAWYKRFLSGSISWSYLNGSFANFGAGASLRTPNFGLYAISDNVYGAFKWKSARLLNIRFGMNFLFGCKNCSRPDKAIQGPGCGIYQTAEEKKLRFAFWKQKLEELKKKRKKGK